MLTSDFYILSWGHLVFVNTKVHVSEVLINVKFSPNL